MPPTKVTGAGVAILKDTCGNYIRISQLDHQGGLICQPRPPQARSPKG